MCAALQNKQRQQRQCDEAACARARRGQTHRSQSRAPLSGRWKDASSSQKIKIRRKKTTESTAGKFHFRRAAFSSHLKNRVGLALAEAVVLRITFNVYEDPITSKSNTHPSHSQTSRLLTSSLSLRFFRCSSSPSNPV
jgi:hypothetical protein